MTLYNFAFSLKKDKGRRHEKGKRLVSSGKQK